MNTQTEMTNQQELELLAEWLGIENIVGHDFHGLHVGSVGNVWNPSPEGNDTDFLNMVAGRVDWVWFNNAGFAHAVSTTDHQLTARAGYAGHNNDKLAAMKHAAYQVCLMAAREGKNG